jgi:hypothetical protein
MSFDVASITNVLLKKQQTFALKLIDSVCSFTFAVGIGSLQASVFFVDKSYILRMP